MPGSSRRRSTSEGEGGILSSTLNLPDYAQTSRLPEFNPARCVSTPHINTTGFIDDTYQDHRGMRIEPRIRTRARGDFSLMDKRFRDEFNQLKVEIYKWGQITSLSAQTIDIIEGQHNTFAARIEQRVNNVLSARGDLFFSG